MNRLDTRRVLRHRILCAIVALVLCVGCMPSLSFALVESDSLQTQDEAPATAGNATLTIVYGLDFSANPQVKVNKTYGFYKDATMVDLLDAAKAAGDIKDYAMNTWNGVDSITFDDGTVVAAEADSSLYWSNYEDGVYSSDTVKDTVLADKGIYQLAWSSYPTAVAPSWSTLAAPETSTHVAGDPAVADAGTATLAIVYGLDFGGTPQVKVNKTYPFKTGATMVDLLNAAKAAGDIKDYAMNSWSGVGSVTFADNSVAAQNTAMSLYWSNYEDGAYASGTVAETVLADKGTYQLAWSSYPTAVAPSWAAVGSPAAGQGLAGTSPAPAPTPGSTPNTPTDKADNGYASLMNAIAQSYVGTSDGWQAMDLAAMGNVTHVDKNAVLAAAKEAYDAPSTTNLQAAILAVTSLGYDASAVTIDGKQLNFIQKMAETPLSTTTLNGQLFALLAYNCNNYAVPPTALSSIDNLLSNVKNAQLADGGFAFSGTTADLDMTAMAIAALQPYVGNATVSAVVDKAVAALKALQNSDGGWGGTWPATTGATNANSTAFAVIALCAVGINPAADWATTDGHTPLGALLTQANADNTGFLFNGSANALATEQGFRALVAYQGLKNTGAAYNIYTQAKAGTAGSGVEISGSDDSASDSATPPAASTFQTNTPAAPAAAKAASTTTAKTNDAGSGRALVCVVLCGLMVAGAVGRRALIRH